MTQIVGNKSIQWTGENAGKNNKFFNFVQIQIFHDFPPLMPLGLQYKLMPARILHVLQAVTEQAGDWKYHDSNDKVSGIHHREYADDEFLSLRSIADVLPLNVFLLIPVITIIPD